MKTIKEYHEGTGILKSLKLETDWGTFQHTYDINGNKLTFTDFNRIYTINELSVTKEEFEKFIKKNTLKNKWIAHDLEEGEDYFPLEKVKGKYHLPLSCWDEQSEEIGNELVFRTLLDALNYCLATNINEVVVSDFRSMEIFNVKIELIK